MSPATSGILALLAANILWGLSPLYYKLLAHIPPFEMLSHRAIWSLIVFGFFLWLYKRFGELLQALSTPKELLMIAVGGMLISINWGLFIWAIQADRVIEASLGYFMFPLVSVVFGMLIFGEVLGRAKTLAVFLAVAAVVILTYGLGVAPVVSLILASTFGCYGVIKKLSGLRPTVSVTGEVVILTPVSLVWIWGVHQHGWVLVADQAAAGFGKNLGDSLLLILAGPITAGPLILFSFAARRLNLATVGLMQYLNPSMQFLLAVFVLAEPFTPWHSIAFPLIWLALAIYSVTAINQERASRKAAIASST